VEGSGTVANAAAQAGSGTAATQGNHQDIVRHQEAQEVRENKAADAATTDSHSLSAARDDQQPTATETATTTTTAAAEGTTTETATTATDAERILRYAFPSCHPNEKAEAACIDRIGEALRLGATPQLLAWAVRSRKATGLTPWARLQECGEMAADLLARARRCWPASSSLESLDKLLAVVSSSYIARNDREREFVPVLQGCREQATIWPPDGRAVAALGVKPAETVTGGMDS